MNTRRAEKCLFVLLMALVRLAAAGVLLSCMSACTTSSITSVRVVTSLPRLLDPVDTSRVAIGYADDSLRPFAERLAERMRWHTEAVAVRSLEELRGPALRRNLGPGVLVYVLEPLVASDGVRVVVSRGRQFETIVSLDVPGGTGRGDPSSWSALDAVAAHLGEAMSGVEVTLQMVTGSPVASVDDLAVALANGRRAQALALAEAVAGRAHGQLDRGFAALEPQSVGMDNVEAFRLIGDAIEALLNAAHAKVWSQSGTLVEQLANADDGLRDLTMAREMARTTPRVTWWRIFAKVRGPIEGAIVAATGRVELLRSILAAAPGGSVPGARPTLAPGPVIPGAVGPTVVTPVGDLLQPIPPR
jgi:hypothetical protein